MNELNTGCTLKVKQCFDFALKYKISNFENSHAQVCQTPKLNIQDKQINV